MRPPALSVPRGPTRAGALACALVAAAATAQDPRSREPELFDPYAGIDRQGRINKPELPPNLPNPERWRYTPPGRIKPGNIFDRLFVTSFISPLFFREEDIGFGGGVALTDTDFRNLGGLEIANIAASYSEEGQQQYRIDWARWLHHRWLPDGGFIRDERSLVNVELEYSRTLTRRFFGFGSETPEEAETSYTEELTVVGVGWRQAVPEPGADVMFDVGVEFQHHGLQRGRVSNVPSTNESFPAAFDDGDGVDQLWLLGGLAYDERDSLHQPYRGYRVGLSAAAAPLQTRGDVGGVLRLDASGVIPVPPLLHGGGDSDEENPPTDVIALGGFLAGTAGNLPFYSLPSLGGTNTLRGFIQNRFTDRVATHGSIEYRFVVVPRGFRFTDTIRIERVSLAPFYDFGTVAGDLGDLFEGEYLDSYGIGARVAFAREAMFRVDAGFSDEDFNLTIAFGNSF